MERQADQKRQLIFEEHLQEPVPFDQHDAVDRSERSICGEQYLDFVSLFRYFTSFDVPGRVG